MTQGAVAHRSVIRESFARPKIDSCPFFCLVEERAHLDGRPIGDDGLAPPRQSLVQVRGFQYPKAAYVLLGLQLRPVGDEHLAIGLRPQGPRAAVPGEATSENPDTGGLHLFVEHVYIARKGESIKR